MPETCRRARDDVEDLQYEDGSKPFFPLDKMRSYFKYQKIKEILECTCAQCQEDLRMFSSRREPVEYVNRIMGNADPNDLRRTFFSVFGLLVYVEHPLFIIGFLDHNCNDYVLEARAAHSTLPNDDLKNWTGEYRRDSVRFDRFARRFRANLPSFAVPHFESAEFVLYDERVVMPFVKEVEIGKKTAEDGHLTSEGANGKVFAFKIYREYAFPGNSSQTEYVRKCILTPEPQAYLESSNIQHVQRFRHNHIVKLIKVFAHGRSINLIFPKALTNLDHLLRDPSFSYGNKRGARLHTADAWTQLLGVCNALKKMHGYDNESGDPTGRGHTCIHFDLKPDNILVERQTGNWLITDFGQAALTERRRGTTPRVGGHFGTDAYAPPEIDDTSMAFGRAYDIWSLGCIMLEVTAFVVRGYVGLTGTSTFAGLDQVRKSMPAWARNDDERFFCQEAPNGEFVVKKEIVDFMENLRSSQRREDDDPASFSFLSTILGLIDRMLKPKVMDRANISRVGDTLSSALNEACATPNEHREHVVVVANNEVELGGPQVKQIRLWHSSANNDGMELSSLAILENHAGFMRLHCWAQGHEPSNITFRRSDVKMVPLYAFWDPGRLQESRTWIDFLYLSDRSCSEVPSSKYSFDGQAGLRQARMIQSVVTSQDIVDSFGLRRVRLRKPPSTRNVLKGLFRTRKPDRESETMDSNGGLSDLGSATVQIWIERNSDYPAQLQRRVSLVSQASTTTRSIHQYDGDRPGVPPCRVCIYLHRQHFICTIKVDVNWVIQESESDEKVLVFKSLPSGRNRTFCVSWLRPTPEELTAGQHFPAGVPLDPRVLQYYEDSDCTEVENLELTFLNADHRDAFKWKYLVTKKDWNSERERIEDRVEVNRIPGRVPRMPDGINHLPMPEDRVPFGANVDFDRDLQSNSSTSTTRSRHDSTIEHIATSPQSEQNPQFLTIPSPRRW